MNKNINKTIIKYFKNIRNNPISSYLFFDINEKFRKLK